MGGSGCRPVPLQPSLGLPRQLGAGPLHSRQRLAGRREPVCSVLGLGLGRGAGMGKGGAGSRISKRLHPLLPLPGPAPHTPGCTFQNRRGSCPGRNPLNRRLSGYSLAAPPGGAGMPSPTFRMAGVRVHPVPTLGTSPGLRPQEGGEGAGKRGGWWGGGLQAHVDDGEMGSGLCFQYGQPRI